MRRDGFAYLLAPGQRKVFFEGFQKRPTEYTEIFNIETSSRAYETDLRVAGLTGVVEKPEGTSTQYVEAVQGGQKTYTHISFGLGYRITREMYDDDLYRVMNRMGQSLARATANAIEVFAFTPLNHAFDASPSTANQGFDSLCLCSTAHTMLGGATQANRPSTDVAFSQTAIRDAVLRFENLDDELGLPILLKPSKFLIAPENKWAAREILNTSNKPYTANNEINALKEEDLSYQVVHYLADTDAWFLVAAGGLQGGAGHDLNFFWRKKPVHETGDDFDTGDMKVKVFFRASVGFGYWFGVDGSYV
jgi:hypothetical protein